MRIVQKFGGSSVADLDRIRHVANRVAERVKEGHQVLVVVSAMGDTTDDLLDLAHKLTPHPSPREMDMMLTTGEQVSISLLSMALHQLGIQGLSMTGWQAGIRTESLHGKARIQQIDNTRLLQELEQGKVPVVAGFQGMSQEKEITTLGRGGSDTTAVALAAAVGADLCEIFTDVTGVYTTDPRVVSRAQKLASVSYDEMLELATLGATVLHPRAVECAKYNQVKLTVRSTFASEEGTVIKEGTDVEKGLIVTGVAHDTDVLKVQVLGLPNDVQAVSRLFGNLAEAKVNVDIIVQSERPEERVNVAFTIGKSDRESAREVLQRLQDETAFASFHFEEGLAKVSIVGAGMITNPGVAANMFNILAEAAVPLKMISTSEIKVSCVVPANQASEAVKRLHTGFGLDA